MKPNNLSVTIEDIISSDNPIEEIKKLNAQIYPAKFHIAPNDKLSKFFFNMTAEEHKKMNNNFRYNAIEKKKFKKVGTIKTSFRIYNNDGVNETDPIGEYEWDILNVIIANWQIGNYYLTPAIIHRGITGKVNDKSGDSKPTPAQRERILLGIRKLMGTVLDTDMTAVCKNLKYNNGKPFKVCTNALGAGYIEATINGQDATVIFIKDEPILYTIAKLKCKEEGKGQLLTYNADLLDAPNINNTTLNITLKNYSLRRTLEIELHHMTPTLTFKDIFQKCRISDASKKTKWNAKQTVIDFFKHLQNIGVIDSFQIHKVGNSVEKISFTYSKKKSVAPEIAQVSNNSDSAVDSKSDNKNDNKAASSNKTSSPPPNYKPLSFSTAQSPNNIIPPVTKSTTPPVLKQMAS